MVDESQFKDSIRANLGSMYLGGVNDSLVDGLYNGLEPYLRNGSDELLVPSVASAIGASEDLICYLPNANQEKIENLAHGLAFLIQSVGEATPTLVRGLEGKYQNPELMVAEIGRASEDEGVNLFGVVLSGVEGLGLSLDSVTERYTKTATDLDEATTRAENLYDMHQESVRRSKERKAELEARVINLEDQIEKYENGGETTDRIVAPDKYDALVAERDELSRELDQEKSVVEYASQLLGALTTQLNDNLKLYGDAISDNDRLRAILALADQDRINELEHSLVISERNAAAEKYELEEKLDSWKKQAGKFKVGYDRAQGQLQDANQQLVNAKHEIRRLGGDPSVIEDYVTQEINVPGPTQAEYDAVVAKNESLARRVEDLENKGSIFDKAAKELWNTGNGLASRGKDVLGNLTGYLVRGWDTTLDIAYALKRDLSYNLEDLKRDPKDYVSTNKMKVGALTGILALGLAGLAYFSSGDENEVVAIRPNKELVATSTVNNSTTAETHETLVGKYKEMPGVIVSDCEDKGTEGVVYTDAEGLDFTLDQLIGSRERCFSKLDDLRTSVSEADTNYRKIVDGLERKNSGALQSLLHTYDLTTQKECEARAESQYDLGVEQGKKQAETTVVEKDCPKPEAITREVPGKTITKTVKVPARINPKSFDYNCGKWANNELSTPQAIEGIRKGIKK